MAEPMQEAPSTHTGRNNSGINSPPKRRPPKLRRNFSPVAGLSEKDGESTKEPDSRQVPRDTDGDVTSIDHESPMDEYVSERESFTAETEPRGGRQRADQPSARQTTVIDRPKTARVEDWQRRVRGRRGSQQLDTIDDITDVGKTVNRAVGTVHDVGSKAISSAGNTAGRALGEVVGVSQDEHKGKDEQLKLRLDLNLDIEVQLKAKIHGDLTLQLLS